MPLNRPRDPIAFMACLLFFVSGASGLVFETLLFHQTRLVLGASVWACALVPAGFMAGLGLGNAAAARTGDRVSNPFRVYAAIELVVGVAGILLVLALPGMSAVMALVCGPILDRVLLLSAVRLAAAFGLLLIPATAMGATLPLLTRALTSADSNFGRVLGRLYGWNTLGAVAGTVLAETVLVGWVGIRGTAWFAGGLNLVAAAGAFALSTRLPKMALPAEGTGPRTSRLRHARWLAVAFASGAMLLSLEVLWFRFLSLYVLTSSVAFALMLAVVLAGIGFGGLIASHWLRVQPNAHRYCSASAFGAGSLTIICYAAFPQAVQYFDIQLATRESQTLQLAIPLMAPVALISGVLFTLTGAALREGMSLDAAAAGALTLANTFGAAIGALVAGFVVLPLLGMERAFFAAALAYGCIGLLAFNRTAPAARRASAGFAAALLAALLVFPFGAMKAFHLRVPLSRWSRDTGGTVLVREGLTETIQYAERRFADRTRSWRLVTNAISMSASDFRNRRYMKLFVYWPVAVHPAPRSALLISYGVGATAKALVDTPELETIDIVDISRDILDMSRLVYPDSPLSDPRVRVHVEDGRFFLQATERQFDIITGEPPPPDLDGVVNLYTREYFQRMRSRLREGGMVSYWLPTHSMAERNSLSVIRAFCDVFEDCSLWNGFGPDLMLVGTRDARERVSDERFRAQWDNPGIAQELRALGFELPGQLGALFVGDAEYLRGLTSGVAPVVDDFPKRIVHPTYFAVSNQDGTGLYGAWLDSAGARTRFQRSSLVQRLWPPAMREQTLEYFDAQQVINRLGYEGLRGTAKSMPDVHRLLTGTPLQAPVLWLLRSDDDVGKVLRRLGPDELRSPEPAMHHAASLIASRQWEESLPVLLQAANDPRFREDALLLRVYVLWMLDRPSEARLATNDVRQRIQPLSESAGQFLDWIAKTFSQDRDGR